LHPIWNDFWELFLKTEREVPMNDPLATYLHDHLAGADMAVDLLQAMKDRHKDESLGQFAGHILAEVKQDRDTLQRLADTIGSGSNVLKEFTAWLSEKASRVKLGEGAAGEFGTFEALEFVALGICGKLSLWHALRVAAATDGRLIGPDFEQLITRAEAQYTRVEERRLATAATALKPVKS
jgi:hypothetical protein